MRDAPTGTGRRLTDFVVAILAFVRRLPREMAADSIIRQVARSAGNMSTHYRDACAARSTPEFLEKLSAAVQEADETDQWLWMAAQLQLGNSHELARLAADAKELRAVLGSALGNARRNIRRDPVVGRQRLT